MSLNSPPKAYLRCPMRPPTPFLPFCAVAIIDVSVVCVVEGGEDDDFSDTLSRVSNRYDVLLSLSSCRGSGSGIVVVVVMAPRLVDAFAALVSSPLCE